MHAIANMLEFGTLETLEIIYNDLGLNAIIPLRRAIQRTRTFRTLTLGGEKLTEEAAISLIDSLSTTNKSPSLNFISAYNLGNTFAKKAAEALNTNSGFSSLHVVNSQINNSGADMIINAIRNSVVNKRIILRPGLQSADPDIALDVSSKIPTFLRKMVISKNQRIILTQRNLRVYIHPPITYYVNHMNGGSFHKTGDNPLFSFTHQDIVDEKIFFQYNGTDESVLPKITLNASNGSFNIPNQDMYILFDKPPQIRCNKIKVYQNQTRTITAEDLSMVDHDSPPSKLVYDIKDITGGNFMDENHVPLYSFTQNDIIYGDVYFKHVGPDAPTFEFSVTDGTSTVGPVAGQIDFDRQPYALNFSLDGIDGYNGVIFKDVHGVMNAGDIDASGTDELLIRGTDAKVYVLRDGEIGHTPIVDLTALDQFKLVSITYPNVDPKSIGRHAPRAGDLNGDGIDDLLFGDSDYNSQQGRVNVFLGRKNWFAKQPHTIDLSASKLEGFFQTPGEHTGDQLGHRLVVTDINDDGINDIIATAPSYALEDPVDAENNGAVYAIFGGPHIQADKAFDASEANTSSAFRIAGTVEQHGGSLLSNGQKLGDLNADAVDDLLTCAPLADRTKGICYVFFGGKNIALTDYESADGYRGFKVVGMVDDYLGHSYGSVRVVPDINGDGYQDLLLGAYFASKLYVIFGGPEVGKSGTLETSSLNGTEGFVIHGAHPKSGFGMIASTHDMNADGYADIMVNRFQAAAKEPLFIIWGGPTIGQQGAINISEMGADTGTIFKNMLGKEYVGGTGIENGDINADGVPDFIQHRSPEGNHTLVIYGVSPNNCDIQTQPHLHGKSGPWVLGQEHIQASCLAYPADKLTLKVQAISNAILYQVDKPESSIQSFTQAELNQGLVALKSTADTEPSLELRLSAGFYETPSRTLSFQYLPSTTATTDTTSTQTRPSSTTLFSTSTRTLTTLASNTSHPISGNITTLFGSKSTAPLESSSSTSSSWLMATTTTSKALEVIEKDEAANTGNMIGGIILLIAGMIMTMLTVQLIRREMNTKKMLLDDKASDQQPDRGEISITVNRSYDA